MLILLYGPNTYLSRQKIKEIKADFLKNTDSSGINMAVFEGEKATAAEIRKELYAAPFLASKRLIILKNALSRTSKKLKEEDVTVPPPSSPLSGGTKGGMVSIETTILEFITEKQENILVLLEDEVKSKIPKFESLKKNASEVYDFPVLKPEDVARFIQEEVKSKKGSISPASASYLAGIIGADLWRASNEIDKLIAFTNGAPITTDIITQLVSSEAESQIFNLIDAIAAKNKAQALSLLENELESEAHPLSILAMITRQFRIIIQIKDLQAQQGQQSSDKIAELLDLHPFVAKKSMPQASQFEMPYLKKIYRYLLSLDKAFKNSMGDPRLLLETFITKI